MPDLSPGAVFAGHRIEGIAGKGGMGVVYRATHIALDHVVALKVISPDLAGDERFRRRFAEESRIAVSIRHPNVVPIHHAGEEDRLLFVTMDLIDGTDLRGVLYEHGRLEPEHAAAIVAQVASALDAAHERGLVHRDIKPGNILIERRDEGEHVYLTDFGLARLVEATTGVTATGAFVGTLDYVAPEQIRGERVDARADVYALGCVLYELLTAAPPFVDHDKVAKMYAHLEEEPQSIVALRAELPGELDAAIGRALAKDPADRFPSAGDLARAVAAAVAGGTTVVAERSVGRGAAAPTAAAAAAAPSVEAPPARDVVEPTVRARTPQATERIETAEPPLRRAPPPVPPKREMRRLLLAALGLVAVGVAVLLALSVGDDGAGDPAALDAEIVEEVRVPGFPVELAHGEGGIWVTSRDLGTVSRIDADPGGGTSTVSDFEVGDAPEGVAIGAGSIWVAVGGTGEVAELDPAGNEVDRVFIDGTPAGAAFGEDSVWVADAAGSRVLRIDPADLGFEEVPTGESPFGIAFGQGSVWVTNRVGSSVSRIEPRNNRELVEIDVGANPKGIAVANGLVFVANTDSANVSVIDPSQGTGELAETIPVGDDPRGVVAAAGFVWVANGADDSVSRIDPEALEVVETVEAVGTGPEGITTGPEDVWVANGEGDTVTRIEP